MLAADQQTAGTFPPESTHVLLFAALAQILVPPLEDFSGDGRVPFFAFDFVAIFVLPASKHGDFHERPRDVHLEVSAEINKGPGHALTCEVRSSSRSYSSRARTRSPSPASKSM